MPANPFELRADVRMEEVGARVRCLEVVDEGTAGPDRRLGDPGNAVHGVRDANPVPVDRRVRLGKVVLDSDSYGLTLLDPQLGSGDAAAERPGRRLAGTELDRLGHRAQDEVGRVRARAPERAREPVAAEGKVYFTAVDGTTAVLAAGGEGKVLAENRVDRTVIPTPALSDGVIYLRARERLYAIAGKKG